MDFHMTQQPFSSNRFPVVAKNGMVCTGNNLASAAGLSMLQKGGNAVDAAIATAAALTVVEPTANGLGSDAFAIVWMKDQMYGLNSTGCAPEAISIDQVKEKHKCDRMPKYGWTPVTVPGAPKAWAALSERFGSLSLEEVLQPAIEYAEKGYPVTPQLARMWKKSFQAYEKYINDPVFSEWFQTFTFDGKAPEAGQIITLPNHAKSLRAIAKSKAAAFYEGELAEAIDADSRKHGGFLRKEDLEKHEALWVDPISVNYHGYDVWEIPPNGQGIVALMALNILKEFSFPSRNIDCFHHQFEAMKMAFADGKQYVSDPRYMKMDYHRLIDPGYGKQRAQSIAGYAQMPEVGMPPKSGTVYLCTADRYGNMVSYIQSNYMGFGSGVVVKGTGIALQNRGHDFSLDETKENALAPGKRTYHTIIPGFLTKDGKAVGPFGVMGGYMQPQGHVQVVMNLIDFHLNPQMALDAPRWQWIKDKTFMVEQSFNPDMARQLKELGHDVQVDLEYASFGRGQMIIRLDNGVLVGGCESRTDSNIACY